MLTVKIFRINGTISSYNYEDSADAWDAYYYYANCIAEGGVDRVILEDPDTEDTLAFAGR